jgi:hypothetical protein
MKTKNTKKDLPLGLRMIANNLHKVIQEQNEYLDWSNDSLDKALLSGESGNLSLRQRIQCIDTAVRTKARALELFYENIGISYELWLVTR